VPRAEFMSEQDTPGLENRIARSRSGELGVRWTAFFEINKVVQGNSELSVRVSCLKYLRQNLKGDELCTFYGGSSLV
jgi:hypothetical protein